MAYQHYRSPFGDTTYTKVFVGGLAWETPTDVMRRYFEQFGDILEAVIITDKNTGKSKGYGFVTFHEPESARRACENPNPVIDGRRANCNIASLGRPRPSFLRGRGQGNVGVAQAGASSSSYSGVAAPLPPPLPPAIIYPPYGYAAYPPDYGYHQGMYNPQYQQAAQYYPHQHHHQQHHVYGSSSSSAGMGSPYGYGYSMHASRGTFPPTTQRFHGGPPYQFYYPTTPPLDASAASFSASAAYPQSPPVPLLQPVPRPRFPPSSEPQTPQQTSAETTTEVGAVTSESPNTSSC